MSPTAMIRILQCPHCQGKGSAPYRNFISGRACTTRCPLCWGLGCIPALEVLMEGRTKLALHYWLCNCAEKGHRIHPSNHDVCPICDLPEEHADSALAKDVQTFFQETFRVRLEFVEAT